MRRIALLAVLALGAGCATPGISLPPEQVTRVQRELEGSSRFLRVSMYATPFFGDGTKRLLTAVPPALVRLLENPDHTPVSPGEVQATWPAGTRVKVLKVEFPSSWVMAERVLYTPRTLAWVYVEVLDAPKSREPWVLVLRPGLKTEDDFLAEIDRLLTPQDLSARLAAFPDAVQEAIRSKNAVPEMNQEALEMAWGYPEQKRFELEGTQRKETWSWAEGARTAVLVNGVVTELKPGR